MVKRPINGKLAAEIQICMLVCEWEIFNGFKRGKSGVILRELFGLKHKYGCPFHEAIIELII